MFEPHPPGGRPFTPADSCGDFLDALLGIVFARPAYIRPDDIHRYAAWVDAFRSHVLDQSWESRRDFRGPVAGLPLRQLGCALRDWVDTVIRADNHALYPTLAVDAARFIKGHAYGHDGYGRESWRLTGLVTPDPSDTWAVRNRLTEPRLKHEITSRLKGTTARCVVPPNGGVPGPQDFPALLGPGELFVFKVERCHLTHENVADRPCVRAVEGDAPRFDIAADLWFRGALLLNPADARPMADLTTQSDSSAWWNRRELPAEVPVRWITDVYERVDNSRGHRRSPVPRYSIENEPIQRE